MTLTTDPGIDERALDERRWRMDREWRDLTSKRDALLAELAAIEPRIADLEVEYADTSRLYRADLSDEALLADPALVRALNDAPNDAGAYRRLMDFYATLCPQGWKHHTRTGRSHDRLVHVPRIFAKHVSDLPDLIETLPRLVAVIPWRDYRTDEPTRTAIFVAETGPTPSGYWQTLFEVDLDTDQWSLVLTHRGSRTVLAAGDVTTVLTAFMQRHHDLVAITPAQT